MYQGRILRYFYQIDKNNYILHFEDGSKELLNFNSFSIRIGNLTLSIDDIISDQNNLLIKELSEIKNKYAMNFKNLSLNKMTVFPTLNKDGFTHKSYYYEFINKENFINIVFDVNCKEMDFKIIMFFQKEKLKFIPLVVRNNKNKSVLVNNLKTYKILESFSKHENSNISIRRNKNFLNMLLESDYLDQNSYYRFNLNFL